MSERILALCLVTLAFGNVARAQLIVAAPAGGPYPGGNDLMAWRIDVATGESAPLWRGWPTAFAVNDLDGKITFPSSVIYTWDYAGQNNPQPHGQLRLPGGQMLSMDGATFALGSLWGVPECCWPQGGLYEIVLAPAGQTSFAHLRKAFGAQLQGLAFDPAGNKFYSCYEGSTPQAGLWSISLETGSGPPSKVKSFPAGVTQVGGLAYGNGKLYLTPRGAGSIYIYDLATATYEATTLTSPSQAVSSTFGAAGWAPNLVPATPPAGRFCSSKMSVMGCVATIGYAGMSSASSSSGFVVSTAGVPPTVGLLLYQIGGPRNSAPFGNFGTPVCFGPAGIRRAPGMHAGGGSPCGGALALDMNAFASGALGGTPSAALRAQGTYVYCRFWGRDTLPGYTHFSDALEYIVGP